MKKENWKTKEEKRKLRKEEDNGIKDLLRIVRHLFKDLPQWLNEMDDPRNSSYTTYTQADLVCLGLLKNICSVESMHSMDDLFNEENCIRTLSVMSGNTKLEEIPHCDTLNYYLMRLSPECLSGIRKRMVATLIRSHKFDDARMPNGSWRIIFDGTGVQYFKEKHCKHCLVEVHKDEEGKIHRRYYHKVLEAKLVLGNGLVISLGTEFIENENEDVPKQDCELNAAKRLLGRIKSEFPRLPICLQGDALYEAETLMAICRENQWFYLFTHKDDRQPTVGKDYNLLDDEDKISRKGVGKEGGTAKYRNQMQKISGKKEEMNIFEYSFEEDGKTKVFKWCTNILLTTKNIGEMVNAGRGRWFIENQGFNFQKNVLYNIEHLNSRNSQAMKNHYLLTQIADIIMQLYLRWNPMVKKMGQGIKNTSSRLLESFRRHFITDEDVLEIARRTSVYLT